MQQLNASIRELELPARMQQLPISSTGYPVPWFVAWIDGVPDFRCVEAGKVALAVRKNLCWLCGGKLGRFKAFVIGPMCAVNRVSAEPPSHRDCAEYAVRACPFLTKPNMRRNEKDLPGDAFEPGGEMLRRNPGVTLIWIAQRFRQFTPQGGGRLFEIGDPISVKAYAGGRAATRAELERSMETGLPALRQIAERQGPEAMRALHKQLVVARRIISEAA